MEILTHGAGDQAFEPVDCLALAAEEAARVSVSMREVAPGAAAFEVIGSPRLLRRLIRNLLENALKHGGPPVEIALTHETTARAFRRPWPSGCSSRSSAPRAPAKRPAAGA